MATRIISLSLGLFGLLMISAYTANLSSYLVVESLSSINDLENVIKKQDVCTIKNSALSESLNKYYKSARINRRLVEKEDFEDAFSSLYTNDCAYVATTVSYWSEASRKEEINKKCDLERSSWSVETIFDAGFAMRNDPSTLCTTFVKDVFDVHLREMHEDGFINQAWDEHLNRIGNEVICSNNDSGMSEQYLLKNVGSIFLLHGFFVIITVLYTLGQRNGVFNSLDATENISRKKSNEISPNSKSFSTRSELSSPNSYIKSSGDARNSIISNGKNEPFNDPEVHESDEESQLITSRYHWQNDILRHLEAIRSDVLSAPR